jgi:3-phosphoglycerate kinase
VLIRVEFNVPFDGPKITNNQVSTLGAVLHHVQRPRQRVG